MSDTPETDAAVKASNGQWSFVLKETCQRLERERDEAREMQSEFKRIIAGLCDERLRLVFENRRLSQERDEARELAEAYKEYAQVLGVEINDMVIHAHVHGLKFSRFKQSKVLHKKIKQLETSK